MKVHIVTHANRARYADAIAQMHRQRHDVFIKRFGWAQLRGDDGLEIDEYDDLHAVYLLALAERNLVGSARLLPSWRRSLTRDHLAAFITEQGDYARPDMWEWTRWIPGDLDRPRSLVQSRKLLLVAGLEFALSRGIESYTAVCDVKVMTQLVELGWAPRPLGLPTRFPEGQAIAITWRPSAAMLRETRDIFAMMGPAAIEAPACYADEADNAYQLSDLMAQLASLRFAHARNQAADALRRLVGAQRQKPDTGALVAGGVQ